MRRGMITALIGLVIALVFPLVVVIPSIYGVPPGALLLVTFVGMLIGGIVFFIGLFKMILAYKG